jgi:hypothetical protein
MGRGLSELQKGILVRLWKRTQELESQDETTLPESLVAQPLYVRIGPHQEIECRGAWRWVQRAWRYHGGVHAPERYRVYEAKKMPAGLTWMVWHVGRRRAGLTRCQAAAYSRALTRLEQRGLVARLWWVSWDARSSKHAVALTEEGKQVASKLNGLTVNNRTTPDCQPLAG